MTAELMPASNKRNGLIVNQKTEREKREKEGQTEH